MRKALRMSSYTVVVKYHNRKMLATIDLNSLINVLMQSYGDGTTIRFEPMNASEREQTLEDVGGIAGVRERFWILEDCGEGRLRRQPKLEETVVSKGVK